MVKSENKIFYRDCFVLRNDELMLCRIMKRAFPDFSLFTFHFSLP
jgi:hypothetical protein